MDDPTRISPLSRFGIIFLVGALVAVLALLGLLNYMESLRRPSREAEPDKAQPASQASNPAPGAIPAARTPSPQESLEAVIAQALAALRNGSIADKPAALEALRNALKSADPKVAMAAIRQFLKTGQDAPTGLGFKVGEGGELAQAPTLRTFLMDQLGTISRDAGTQDAAVEARATLDGQMVPDEWAVAMRNMAWNDPGGSKTYLAGKVRELLQNSQFQQNPTGGYLEAFDVAAYAGDASLIADLAPLAQTPSKVQQAALVALERLSAMAPASVASYLNANPNVLADRPMLRADYMGNMDLNDPAQDTQAQAYLQRADVSQAEKEKFLARLATPAGFVSDNLLTPPSIAPMTLDEHAAMVNRAATNWLASGAFPALTAPLQTLVTQTKPSG
jgi:hypothetical protein